LSSENGYRVFRMPSTTAVSACISPSIVMSGRRSLTISTARFTFRDSGCGADPKFEKEIIATRGLIESRRTKSAVRIAVSAMSSAVGSMLTVVSEKKYSWSWNTSMNRPATLLTPDCIPIVCRAGRSAFG